MEPAQLKPKKQTYNSREIAAILEIEYATWCKKKHTYIKKHNFPPPLPGPGHPRWSIAQVDLWFSSNGTMKMPGETEPPGEKLDIIIEGITNEVKAGALA